MADRPQSDGTHYRDFVDDSDITTTRPPFSNISNFTQLTAFERMRLSEHLRAWFKVVDKEDTKAHQLTITKDQRRRFNEELFDRWSSSYGTQELPSSPSKKRMEDSRLCVSVWSEDLPLSVAAKRKRGSDDDDETPSPKKTKRDGRTSPRKRGQPAFVTINKTIGKGETKVSFDFKDNVGQLATSEFIQWDDPLGAESLKAKAMVQHDMHEQERIRNFNTELIIRSARNYIVEVAKAGTPQQRSDLFKQIHAENARIIAFAESLSHSEAT
ncbi:hypothetical protein FAUST_6319 [Fusarium austroamericanum]|uniref:Uncharacterized protein n=1 Tax=Fusarium austroamericanum TaxID=282268 RepID=A0AAN6BZ98_FUSAU|nr:hypothetical protein FAUST_6319 [Fusarium austroamericanum]